MMTVEKMTPNPRHFKTPAAKQRSHPRASVLNESSEDENIIFNGSVSQTETPGSSFGGDSSRKGKRKRKRPARRRGAKQSADAGGSGVGSDIWIDTGKDSTIGTPINTVGVHLESGIGQAQRSSSKKRTADLQTDTPESLAQKARPSFTPSTTSKAAAFLAELRAIEQRGGTDKDAEEPAPKRVKADHRANKAEEGETEEQEEGQLDSCSTYPQQGSQEYGGEWDPNAEYPDEYYIWKRDDIPKNLRKYWLQRYNLFSKYDEGIMLDEGKCDVGFEIHVVLVNVRVYRGLVWGCSCDTVDKLIRTLEFIRFSVTPEKVAEHHAQRLACGTIIDAFCGVGGNAIQFAKTCRRVVAVDIDPIKLRCTRHNAQVYGVEDKIEFVQGDILKLADTLKGDAVFLSPPWGGPDYLEAEVYDIHTMMPIDCNALFDAAKRISPNICLYMPRNVNQQQLIDLAGPGGVCEIEEEHLNGKFKAIVAYYGNLVRETQE